MATPQALTPAQIAQIVAAGQGGSVNLGGTIYQPQFTQLGGGEGGSLGPLESIYGYTPDQNKVGGSYLQYDPTGAYTRTGTQQKVSNSLTPFVLGSAALFGGLGGGFDGLFGGGADAAAAAADADIAGGLIPEYGSNAAYGGFMSSAMTPEAMAALEATIAASPEILGSGALATTAAANAATTTPATTASTTAATTTGGLTASQLASLASAGINIAGLLSLINSTGTTTPKTTATPITYSGSGAGGYAPEYFSQVQNTYNSLMPGVPRDVATPLQQWYSTEFNPGASITASLFGDMTTGTTPTATTLKPVTSAVVKPVILPAVKGSTFVGGTGVSTVVGGTGNDTIVGGTGVSTVVGGTGNDTIVGGTGVTTIVGGTGNDTVVGGTGNDTVVKGSDGYQYAVDTLGWTPSQYIGSINQWIIDNPRATRAEINAAMAQAGVTDADVQAALTQSNFSDATKYALTHGGSLRELGDTISNWLETNPTATNAQIQAEQAKWGISDQDIANALYGLNSSAAKEYAVVHDMGLNQYYQNIADAARSGITAEQAVAQMQQYGVSPTDVKQAYSLFSPSGGLTLDEVLAAYNK